MLEKYLPDRVMSLYRTMSESRLMTEYIHALQRTHGYYFDRDEAVYRSRYNNRAVSEETVLANADRYEETITENIVRLTERFVDGGIDLESWQVRVADEIKNGYIVSASVGRGGRDQMTSADWGRVGGRLRWEYTYLENFALEIYQGNLTEAQILQRAKLYGRSVRVGYFDGLTAAKQAGVFVEERRVLGVAEHCPDCIEYANMGWQPIGTLPEPGERSVCLRNCKCSKHYR